MFEERPGPIKQFFNQLFKQEEKTVSEMLAEGEAELSLSLSDYAAEYGQKAPVSNAEPKSAPTAAPMQDNGPLTPGDDIPGGL